MEAMRVQKLRKALERQQLDAILITNSYNRRYISGFTGTSGYVLVTADRAWFLTDFRYLDQAALQAVGFEIVEHQPRAINTVKELLESVHLTRLAVEQDDLSYGTYQEYQAALGSIALVPVSGVVERLRMIKEESELAVLQEACDLADRTFTHILPFLKPGAIETDIALEMEMFMRKNGAVSSSFDTIIASGERSAMPHGVASGKALARGELITMDYGALYKGYCSDITRTVALGQVPAKLREIYDIVLEANLKCIEGLRPGMTGKQGDAIARDIIAAAGYGDRFGHGTGHAVGLEIHENPRLSLQCDTVLEPGMVVTVEPGIYLPGLGGVRIEDDVVITETGVRVLTRASKEFLEIG
jgi:Xaa-Pro aminopeptidase